MDDRLEQARLLAEKWIRSSDPNERRQGADLKQILEGERTPPLLHVIFDALTERGWQIAASVSAGTIFIDPEGNRYGNVEAAVTGQTMREIALAEPPPEGTAA